MDFFSNKKTRALIFIMCALVLSTIVISHYYYKSINEAIDSRIVEARILYEKYNVYAQNNEFDSIFLLMDSIEAIYTSIEHYRTSYEVGVLYNNRAASFLTMALFKDDIEVIMQDSLINKAQDAANRSIEIYQLWIERFLDMSNEEIGNSIKINFYAGLENYSTDEWHRYFENRIIEIKDSQIETNRRLSVSYTNLGIIYRHKLHYGLAAQSYKTAIDLWDRNLTAENNLNVLLGRPLKERSFIQRLFPPDRD